MTAPVDCIPRGVALAPDLRDGSAVKVIGLGGVGGIVARYLTLFLRPMARDVRVVLVDGDSFEAGNRARMSFARYGNKADVTRDALLPLVQDSCVSLLAVPEYLTEENVGRILLEGDAVILAVDNHATRKLASDFCGQVLKDVCLISGGNDGIEERSDGRSLRGTYGNCQVFLRRDGIDVTPPLTLHHPEIDNPSDRVPGGPDCAELATSVPQVLFANLMAASSILNAFWLHSCGALHYGEICFDIADGLMRPLPLPRGWAVSGPLHPG